MKSLDPNSEFTRAVAEFNQLFGFTFRAEFELRPEDLQGMARLARLRGRSDVAEKFESFAEAEK